MRVRLIKRGSGRGTVLRRRRKVAAPPSPEKLAREARFERLAVACSKCGTRVYPGAPMKAHRRAAACRIARDARRVARAGLVPLSGSPPSALPPSKHLVPGATIRVWEIRVGPSSNAVAWYVRDWAMEAIHVYQLVQRLFRRYSAIPIAREYPLLRALQVRGALGRLIYNRAARDRRWLSAVVAATRLGDEATVAALVEETLWGAKR